MKIRLCFKTPDVVTNGIESDCNQHISQYDITEIELRIAKWVKYGEYVYLEYDSETNSIRVCEA